MQQSKLSFSLLSNRRRKSERHRSLLVLSCNLITMVDRKLSHRSSFVAMCDIVYARKQALVYIPSTDMSREGALKDH